MKNPEKPAKAWAMKLLRAFMIPALCALISTPAVAAKLSLSELSSYLNTIKSATGEFTQVNDDGTISTGTIYIKRPGRVRFEYNPPDKTLVVSNGELVGIVDPKSNQAPEAYSLDRTPLSIILATKVDLTRAKMVTAHNSDGKTTTVRAQDPKHPEYGSIDLVFTSNPTQLRQWVINDNTGTKTTVILGDLKNGVKLNNTLFVIPGKNLVKKRQ